ncbi:MAG: 50S ribosomal protein L10 [Mycoplasmataceae bacterium]|nr:50S ribosomal protein L10 [Mycoplasmataceae bacterium]
MGVLKDNKKIVVKEIAEKIKKAQSVIVANYEGINVKQFQALRKAAKNEDVELKVYKNRLVIKAIDGGEFKELSSKLVGANLYAFANSDPISAAKILATFAKKNKELELIAGIFEKKVINYDEVMEIALLPSYEEALTILAGSLQGAVRQVAVGLKMLVDENHIKE